MFFFRSTIFDRETICTLTDAVLLLVLLFLKFYLNIMRSPNEVFYFIVLSFLLP